MNKKLQGDEIMMSVQVGHQERGNETLAVTCWCNINLQLDRHNLHSLQTLLEANFDFHNKKTTAQPEFAISEILQLKCQVNG